MTKFVLFYQGNFGAAVAAQLAQAVPNVHVLSLVASAASLDTHVRGAKFVGLALWRRYHGYADRLDEACTRAMIPWSSVTLEGADIQCGPVIAPGRGPCYACF